MKLFRRVSSLLLVFCIFLITTSFNAWAQKCEDYFAENWGHPLEMSSSEDLLANIMPEEVNDFTITSGSPFSYSGGIVTMTISGSNPWFKLLSNAVTSSIADNRTTRYGDNHPIDTSKYGLLTIRMYSSQANALTATGLQVFWRKGDKESYALTRPIEVQQGWNTYTIDLSDPDNVNDGEYSGDYQWTSSDVYELRIDPLWHDSNVGAVIKFDYIYLTPTSGCSPDTGIIDKSASLLMPDELGGEDYFTVVKGAPAIYDSASTISALSGTSEATIYPGNAFTDSNYNTFVDDHIRFRNDGSTDQKIYFVKAKEEHRIDASKYKHFCVSGDFLMEEAETSYHGMTRITWIENEDSTIGYNSEDYLVRTTGLNTYCQDLSKTVIYRTSGNSEEGEDPWPNVPARWQNYGDSSYLKNVSFDSNEEDELYENIITWMRLAADHKADDQYALVIDTGTDRSYPVTVKYNTTKSLNGATTIQTISGDRESDVVLWDTSNLSAGEYFVFTIAGDASYSSFAPVTITVDHDYSDEDDPILDVASPLEGHRFEASNLQLVLNSIDNIRIAAIEALIDGNLIFREIQENLEFDKDFRDSYLSYPMADKTLVNTSIDISSLNLPIGDYTFTVKVYDTAGNLTTNSSTITLASTDLTPDIELETPNEDSIAVDLEDPANEIVEPFSLVVKQKKKTGNILITLDGDCTSNVEITSSNVNSKLWDDSAYQIYSGPMTKETMTATKMNKLADSTKIFFQAKCLDTEELSRVRKIAPSKIKSNKSIKKWKRWVKKLKRKL